MAVLLHPFPVDVLGISGTRTIDPGRALIALVVTTDDAVDAVAVVLAVADVDGAAEVLTELVAAVYCSVEADGAGVAVAGAVANAGAPKS